MELQINPRFKEAIPPLSSEEYENLRESIKTDGCRDAIITWNGVIVDGHNRFQICMELDIPFLTIENSFEDEDAVVEWIMRNQLARRNLSDVERGRIALKLKDFIAAKARENCSIGGELKGLANLPNLSTRKELANIARIGERTLAKIEKVDSEAPMTIREAMGKTISIDKAARLNTTLKNTPEDERENEAKRLLAAEYKEREERIYREEKMVKALHNIIAAATIDYEYITGECVDVFIKKSPMSIAGIAKSIDGEIDWLVKLKKLFLSRDNMREDMVDGE